MAESMELAVVTPQNAVEIFTKGGLSAILDGIEAKVRSVVLDGSTPSGRDDIRSLAYKVARTKTALDAEAKKLTEGWRDSTKKVNEERKVAQERLEALADEVRAPLTAFESKEKTRVAAHESALAELFLYSSLPTQATVDELFGKILEFSALHTERNWEEFSGRAGKQRSEIEAYLNDRLDARTKFDADQAELARHRKEEAERLVREREERLKAEAAESARITAERRAKEAADAEAARVIAAAKAEQERVQVEADRVRAEHERAQKEAEAARKKEQDARELAERRAAEAESARIEALRKAESDKRTAEEARVAAFRKAAAEKRAAELKAADDLKEAQEKAARDAEAAVERERERIERGRKAAEEVRIKREADEKHRSKIRAEIMADIAGFEKLANAPEAIINAIMNGKVRHVRVEY